MDDFFAMINFNFGCMSCGITHAVFRMFTIMIKYLRLLYKSNKNVCNMGPLNEKKIKNKTDMMNAVMCSFCTHRLRIGMVSGGVTNHSVANQTVPWEEEGVSHR